MIDPQFPNGDPSASDRSEQESHRPERPACRLERFGDRYHPVFCNDPDDDLEGVLDRPALTDCRVLTDGWLPEALANLDIYRHRCLCGMGFCTDNGFAAHLQTCQAVQPT